MNSLNDSRHFEQIYLALKFGSLTFKPQVVASLVTEDFCVTRFRQPAEELIFSFDVQRFGDYTCNL
eukprot:snap_masked-scaffold_1-processed-gene-26.39-mRNA-1 protein AED:1.00 eAED:1.00 QI:0/0/0/0/1/1/2/0/65